MTRLEKQIADKQAELNELVRFSNEKLSIFNSARVKFEKVLKTYKITAASYDNTMVDGAFEGGLILRIWVLADTSHLTDRQRKNLETKLRGIVPMPACPISLSSISLVYHD